MANDIVLYEREIDKVMPTITNILAATPGLPARSFKSAMLSQMVRSKAAAKLMECSLPSFLNCASTFAGLGLMPDGVTGQAYMLPFKGIATPVIGYKGYNTLGERAGRTIDGDVVRDGDQFDWGRGTEQWVKHKNIAPAGARITHAWAVASAPNRTPLVVVLPIEDLEAVRAKAPAGNYSDSPWMDLKIGRPAMYSKSAKRRLARGMPLLHGPAGGYVVADALEGRFDATSRPHYLLPGQDGQLHITDGETGEQVDIKPPPEDMTDPTEPTKLRAMISTASGVSEFDSVGQWKMALYNIIERNATKHKALVAIRAANAPYLAEAATQGFSAEAMEVGQKLEAAIAGARKE